MLAVLVLQQPSSIGYQPRYCLVPLGRYSILAYVVLHLFGGLSRCITEKSSVLLTVPLCAALEELVSGTNAVYYWVEINGVKRIQ